MPLRYKNFAAWIESNGETLEMYELEEDEDGIEIFCYVESKIGQVRYSICNFLTACNVLMRAFLGRNLRYL